MTNTIREERTKHGWSQEDFASRLGVSRQTIISLEKGKFDPSLPLAFKIAALLNRQIEEVFTPEV